MTPTCLDHLVYTTPDLARGVAEIEALSGVRASPGGQHLGWGTHNALAALGSGAYLEIIAPDPAQPAPAHPRPFQLDSVPSSRLLTWALRCEGIEAVVEKAAAEGLLLGEILSGSRARQDGTVLSWRLSSPWTLAEQGLVPFLIDWGSSPHPSAVAAQGLALQSLRSEHPHPTQLERWLAALGVEIPVERAERAALVAVIDSPRGRLELR